MPAARPRSSSRRRLPPAASAPSVRVTIDLRTPVVAMVTGEPG